MNEKAPAASQAETPPEAAAPNQDRINATFNEIVDNLKDVDETGDRIITLGDVSPDEALDSATDRVATMQSQAETSEGHANKTANFLGNIANDIEAAGSVKDYARQTLRRVGGAAYTYVKESAINYAKETVRKTAEAYGIDRDSAIQAGKEAYQRWQARRQARAERRKALENMPEVAASVETPSAPSVERSIYSPDTTYENSQQSKDEAELIKMREETETSFFGHKPTAEELTNLSDEDRKAIATFLQRREARFYDQQIANVYDDAKATHEDFLEDQAWDENERRDMLKHNRSEAIRLKAEAWLRWVSRKAKAKSREAFKAGGNWLANTRPGKIGRAIGRFTMRGGRAFSAGFKAMRDSWRSSKK
jgi:hypothetical protein